MSSPHVCDDCSCSPSGRLMMSGVIAIFFVEYGCAWYGKVCGGACVLNGHVYCDFNLRIIHEHVGAESHSFGHFRPRLRS